MVPEEAGGIFLCLNTKRDEYDTQSLLFSVSAYAARAQQKLQQAVRTNSSAFEFVQHFVSMTAALLCCYSKPSERAAICFVPPAVCTAVRVVPEGSWRHFSDEYDT